MQFIFILFFSLFLIFRNVESRVAPIDAKTNCFQAPNVCPNENIQYWLYTRNDQQIGTELNLQNNTDLSQQLLPCKDKQIKIIVHGYTGNRNDTLNIPMRKAFFQFGNFCVISVDWSKISVPGCALTSAKNCRVVGNCTANLIDKMTHSIGIKLEDIHVIGHSLGGQAVAFISLKDGEKVSHITSLDPALSSFETSDLSQRLDPTDGKWVEVYHTSADSHSFIDPVGHIDFYWNDGKNQPGCEELDQIETSPGNDHSCSHNRAFEYYYLSLYPGIEFYGEKCEFEGNLPLKNCNNETIIRAGYPVPQSSTGIYRVVTSDLSAVIRNLSEPILSYNSGSQISYYGGRYHVFLLMLLPLFIIFLNLPL
ncbi:phospholipase A1-like [Chrysoperla carnea]|uniref:phospholipase A1-like n=1 Tax=Chrysoperla carnea TaxID=189513 RepID=UPI001D06D9C9|nr:phospholipase A1-like [Chrysoperla carnea]